MIFTSLADPQMNVDACYVVVPELHSDAKEVGLAQVSASTPCLTVLTNWGSGNAYREWSRELQTP